MYLLVDPDEIGIKHAEDSPGLHVGLGSSYGNGELDALLQRTGFGRVREGHAFLLVDRLRAGTPNTEGFEAMIDFARGKGWVEGESVRAHLVRPDRARAQEDRHEYR